MRWYLLRFLDGKCAALVSSSDPSLVNTLLSEGWESVHRKVYQYYLRGWNANNVLVQTYSQKKGIFHNVPSE
jgi:hypothetical protein